jgi:hypothetical protein
MTYLSYAKRSTYALVCISIIHTAQCSPFMAQNVSSYVPVRNNSSIQPPHNIPPLYSKPNLIPADDDDFLPTLTKLLSTRSIRKSVHPRRTLSLKLLTLLLQDDNLTSATTERPPPIPETTRPIRGDSMWTPPQHAAVGIDLVWSGNVHSVIGKPATWKGGFGKPTIVTGSTAETAGDTTTTPQGTVPIVADELVLRPVDDWVEEPVIDVIDVWPV